MRFLHFVIKVILGIMKLSVIPADLLELPGASMTHSSQYILPVYMSGSSEDLSQVPSIPGSSLGA